MPTSYQPPEAPPSEPTAVRFERPVEVAWVAGVCAGLAEQFRVPVRGVRFVTVALAALGVGLPLYLVLWALTPQRIGPTGTRGSLPAVARSLTNESVVNAVLGIVLVLIGAAILLEQYGVDLRLGLVLPLTAICAGAIVVWSQLDTAERGQWLREAPATGRRGIVRVLLGVMLAVAGIVALGSQAGWSGVGQSAGYGLIMLAGVAIILAPWVFRLWQRFRTEQDDRIRATERADIAAHLHDSVLQTLALIQRKADDPTQVVRLARAQERELRAWLYGGGTASAEQLAGAVTEAVHDLEDRYGVPVDLVVTGDRTLDDESRALVRALTEATSNAVRHGAPPVSVYVEVGRTQVEAFVRDHGTGFELNEVPQDRLGVRRSILDRMTRAGGTARIRRLDDGTEVSLILPVEQENP